ncbi:hypothetical protein [Anaerosalibacter massiliensis]|uniref:Uncharacterized protein n=1 Tax=Anaerosalibacter massiliensis TaxID=1347392 RepID=A0A9X2MJU1_9FIRM|nr:hypothetical protein [Anaerosalibacter massiliensis]MCR2044929.1 hypothetical protein [Anaerosalibacter massiliensis]
MDNNILYEKIYTALIGMSKEYSVNKVEEINMVENIGIGIDTEDLIKYLKSKNNPLFEELKKINIRKEELEIITIIITNIKGK